MTKAHHTCAATMAILAAFSAADACAQNYPVKPLRIVAAEPGGIIDFAARLIAPMISTSLGQPVIIENRGSGVIQVEIVDNARPDGYTLLIAGGALWAEPLIRHTPFDPFAHFAPVVLVTKSPNLVAVHPSLPVNSLKELIALAKAKPGSLNYSSSTTGTSSHLAAELFKSMAGVDIVRIPYKGTAAALNALIGGQVQVMFPNAGAEPQRKAGRIKGLAVTSAEASSLFPDLPPISATLPGYESVSLLAIFAPAKTPRTVIERLNQEIGRVLARPDIKEKLASTGAEVVGGSPEQLAAAVKSDIARLSKLIRDADIRAE